MTALVGLGALPSCTWLVDASAAQCRSDGDCARFAGSACNRARGICMALAVDAGGEIGGPTCRGPDGCAPCPAGFAAGPANACSDSTCAPFDNGRLQLRAPEGGLRPLPPAMAKRAP